MDRYPDKFTFWRNISISALSGVLFSVGWWIYLDAATHYSKTIMKEFKTSCLPGIGSTLSMIVVFFIPYSRHFTTIYYRRCRCTPWCMKFVLFCALLSTFCFFIWSIYIWIVFFLIERNVEQYPGLAIALQNLCIMTANLVYKFGRAQDE